MVNFTHPSTCYLKPLDPNHRRRNRRALGARAPPRFCNKQRSALFVFRKCPLFLKEKSVLEVPCPSKVEMLPTSLTLTALVDWNITCRIASNIAITSSQAIKLYSENWMVGKLHVSPSFQLKPLDLPGFDTVTSRKKSPRICYYFIMGNKLHDRQS